MKKEYGTPRRTLVEQGRDGEINDIDVIANEETIVVSKKRKQRWAFSLYFLLIFYLEKRCKHLLIQCLVADVRSFRANFSLQLFTGQSLAACIGDISFLEFLRSCLYFRPCPRNELFWILFWVLFWISLQTLSEKGYIKRMAAGTFTAQNRGTTGKSGGKMRSNDAMSDFFVCRTHYYVLFFRSGLSSFPCSSQSC